MPPRAISASNSLYLATTTGKPEYRERAEKTILAFEGFWENSPVAMPSMSLALAELLGEAKGQQ